MRGIVYDGASAVVTDALEVRAPGAGEVMVRMVAAGVCHSDQSVLDGTIPFPTPVVMGHEGAGVVEEVGSEVTTVAPGDHVVVTTLASCGRCDQCAAGWPTRCKRSLGNMTQPFTFNGEPAWNFERPRCSPSARWSRRSRPSGSIPASPSRPPASSVAVW
jgi:S-(hydroxymethyl)glutathione dehydrogenase/alcohol dehydrogenase